MVWAYPFLFRAPHIQKRESLTVAGPTRVGLLLEVTAIGLAFVRAPGTPRTSSAFLVGALGPQYPWYWSAGVLAGLFGLSACILNFRVRSLDRLK